MIPFSVLDLSRIIQGATAADALHDTLEIAQQAERFNYKRVWFAEHHNMTGVASAATAVVIAYVAGAGKLIAFLSVLASALPVCRASRTCSLVPAPPALPAPAALPPSADRKSVV